MIVNIWCSKKVLRMVKQDFACYYQLLYEKWKARKHPKVHDSLKKSQAANPPNYSCSILPSTFMAVNAKFSLLIFSTNSIPAVTYFMKSSVDGPPMVKSHQSSPHTAEWFICQITQPPIHPFSEPSTMMSANVNFDFDPMAQLFSTHFKNTVPSHFLTVSSILFQTNSL